MCVRMQHMCVRMQAWFYQIYRPYLKIIFLLFQSQETLNSFLNRQMLLVILILHCFICIGLTYMSVFFQLCIIFKCVLYWPWYEKLCCSSHQSHRTWADIELKISLFQEIPFSFSDLFTIPIYIKHEHLIWPQITFCLLSDLFTLNPALLSS